MEGHVVEVEKSAAEQLSRPAVKLTIDGKPVEIKPARLVKNPFTGRDEPRVTTIYDAALQVGVDIPILCHREHMTPVAVCRFCAVDVGGRVLTAACHRQVEDGMKVQTHHTSEKVRKSISVLTELLLTDNSAPRKANQDYADNELRTVARKLGVQQSRFPKRAEDRGQDESSVVIAVDHNACVLCDRCIRGCNEIRHNEVLGRAGKGFKAHIAFDLNNPMGESSCVSCGECMVSCPTGALTFRKVVDVNIRRDVTPQPQEVSAAELAQNPLFEGVSQPFLEWNHKSVVRRRFKKGDVVCREGEYGSTAFVIESGSVDVFLDTPIRHAKAEKKGKGGLFSFLSFPISLVKGGKDREKGRGENARESEEPTGARFIPIDAPTPLDLSKGDKPVAVLTADDLIFGEMSCMNNYPRSATVVAREDTVVLEMLRNVLYILQRNKKSKEKLDAVYRKRAIDGHLRSVPIFASLLKNEAEFKEFVEFFRDRVTLRRLNPGDVVFHQGDPATFFYMVRVGFVKVSQHRPGGDHVLAYIGPGGYFGEIALLSDLPELQGKAPPGVRTATCTVLDHADLIRMTREDFLTVLQRFPTVREQLIKTALENLESNEQLAARTRSESLGEFVRQGLYEAQSLLVLDLEKCTRCDECTKACADAHGGVTRLIREGLRFSNYLVASSCRSCLDPYCMVGCPVGSIRRRKSREIIIEDWCIGCGKCAENCPYGNINMHPFPTGQTMDDPDHPGHRKAVVQQKATMCDLCTELDGQPSCVYACPHDAAHRMKGAELIGLVDKHAAR
jgi:CRP-like cAMP-binding protein/Fe-S-cluster-containing dehydrogenase component